MNSDINIVGLIFGFVVLILIILLHEFIHLWTARHLGYKGKFIIHKIKHLGPLGFCPGVKLTNQHDNIICATDMVPIFLAPLFPTIFLVTFSLVVIKVSLGSFAWYDIFAGAFFGIMFCSMDIYNSFWLKKWWIKKSRSVGC